MLTVLSGMTRMEHLQDNLKTYSPLDPLTEEEFSFLQEIAARMMQFDTIPCNDCKYCMPCPYGIDIPAILLHYNKCLNEGNTPSSPAQEGSPLPRKATGKHGGHTWSATTVACRSSARRTTA